MSSFAIDQQTRELKIPLELVEGIDEAQQRLQIRYRFFVGTWFLDLLQGIPYYQDILIKNPNLPIVGAIFRQVALSTPGIVSLSSFSMNLDGAPRNLSVDFSGVYEDPDVTQVDNRFLVTRGGDAV